MVGRPAGRLAGNPLAPPVPISLYIETGAHAAWPAAESRVIIRVKLRPVAAAAAAAAEVGGAGAGAAGWRDDTVRTAWGGSAGRPRRCYLTSHPYT